jgi:transposase
MLQLEVHDSEMAELRQVARQAVGRVSERAHFVLLSGQGYSPPAIGGLLGYDVQTVRTWLTAYQLRGCAGLADAPRSGRPLKDRELTAVVQAQAGQPPPNFGYLQSCWTVALLVLHLATRFRLTASVSRVRRALHQAEFRWKRPKLAPARRRDPQADAKTAKIAAAVADSTATLLAEDEADQQLLPVLRAMWQRVGQQMRIPTPGQNAKRGVFGALNVRSGEWFYQLTAHKRSAEFIAFLTRLLVAYPTGRVYLLVDNASIHTSRAVQRWLAAHGRLELLYLPTYSGHRLNPVEKVWWALKGNTRTRPARGASVAANRAFRNLAELDLAIHGYFADFPPARVLALINCELVRQAQLAAQPIA